MKKEVTCSRCGGKGYLFFGKLDISKRTNIYNEVDDEGTCPSCKGKGSVAIHEPTKTCPRCRGNGRVYERGNNIVCPTCSGIGNITLDII